MPTAPEDLVVPGNHPHAVLHTTRQVSSNNGASRPGSPRPHIKPQEAFIGSGYNPVYVFPSPEEAQLKSFAEKYKTAFLLSNLSCWSKQENTKEAGIS